MNTLGPDTILISIEGNIGSGKSTILRKLKETFPEWTFVDEPVDVWLNLKNNDGESLLEVFYKDKKRWSYTFQNVALLHRFQKLKHAIESRDTTKKNVIVMERSIFTDKMIFTMMLRDSGFIDSLEWKVYQDWFNYIDSIMPHMDGYVYINTTPEKCLERIATRHREGESIIPLSYLQDLDKYHHSWLFAPDHTKPVLDYDNNHSPDIDLDKIKSFVESFHA